MDQQHQTSSFPMTDIKRPPDPHDKGYSSSYAPDQYAPGPLTKKPQTKEPQASKSCASAKQGPKSYAQGLYEPKSYTPDPYAPKSYSSAPYKASPYSSAPYAPSYSSDPCATTSYSKDPYAPTYSSDPWPPVPSAPEHIEFSDDGCAYTIEVIPGDCPSPPPYSCKEVHCDKTEINTGCCTVSSASQPPVVVAGIFSAEPASTICPCCRQIITTEVVFRVGSLTYAICTCMCMVGCCLGCCLAPFACKCCKDVDHYCPCCRYHIYRYKRM